MRKSATHSQFDAYILKEDAVKKHTVTGDRHALIMAKAGGKKAQVAVAMTHKSHRKGCDCYTSSCVFMAKKHLLNIRHERTHSIKLYNCFSACSKARR